MPAKSNISPKTIINNQSPRWLQLRLRVYGSGHKAEDLCEFQGAIRVWMRRYLRGEELQHLEDVAQMTLQALWMWGPDYWTPPGVCMVSKQTIWKWRNRARKHLAYEHVPVECAEITENQEFLDYSFADVLSKLPSDQQSIVRLHYGAELTWAEICLRTGWSEWRVRTLWELARANLRIMLGGEQNA